MLFNNKEWSHLYNKGPRRYNIHLTDTRIILFFNCWHVRFIRWEGFGTNQWNHKINNISYISLMVF